MTCRRNDAVAADGPGFLGLGRAACDRHVGHRIDGRQRFASKAKTRDALKIVKRSDFACSVTLKGQRQVFLWNPAAVVGDHDTLDAALFQTDLNIRCTGIQRVLNQFLDDGSRTLDHFARSNLADQPIGKLLNLTRCRRLPLQFFTHEKNLKYKNRFRRIVLVGLRARDSLFPYWKASAFACFAFAVALRSNLQQSC